MWCWMIREKDGPRMGWGSEVRGERVLEMPVAGLHFQLSSWFPQSLWRTRLKKIQSFFIFSQRMVHLPPTGHLRVRFKNRMWTVPNMFQSSLRALLMLFSGVCDQGMHLPSLVTLKQFQGWCCQNQDKRERSMNLWR